MVSSITLPHRSLNKLQESSQKCHHGHCTVRAYNICFMFLLAPITLHCSSQFTRSFSLQLSQDTALSESKTLLSPPSHCCCKTLISPLAPSPMLIIPIPSLQIVLRYFSLLNLPPSLSRIPSVVLQRERCLGPQMPNSTPAVLLPSSNSSSPHQLPHPSLLFTVVLHLVLFTS